MKIEQKLENTQQYQSNNPYFVWEQHNVTLIRSKNYGYGIAISGGLCNGHQDPSIYVSDIVPRGPAEHKLYINDKLLSVNGVNIENVEHSFVIRLLKEAKEFIHLVIKRKINDIYNTKDKDIMLKELQNSNNIESQSTIKRCNQAILQTANTILSNFSQNETNNEPINIQNDLTEKITKNQNTIPLLKPIKVTLNRKDKKEGFGIVLGCKYYIKDILTDSLGSHENSNLRKGDILLKMNDITMEQLSLSEAKKILVKSNKLNLSVKRNSLEVNFDDSDDVLSEENISPVSSTNTSPPLPKESVENHILLIPPPLDCTESQKNYQNVPEIPENEHKLSTKQLFKPISNVGSDISTQNRNSKFYSNKNAILNYRTIRFARENGIGIRLAGGNKVGIFICDVQYNSPAERAGLKIADKLIKVNGTDYSTLTREEAVHHILMIQNTIEMVVALSQEEYEQYAFDPLGGDSFYIRTHFNYTSQNHVDLNFQINDILHVTDTLYNGVMGQWVATKLSDSSIQNIAKGGHNNLPQSNEQSRGTIPNQTNAEQIVSSAQTIDQICMSENPIQNPINNLHSIGASARMSIRKKLGKSALAKRSKSASRSNANSDSEETQKPETKLNNTKKIPDNIKVSKANTFCGSKYPAYEKVVLKEVNFTRPVVIFGSLADVARDRLKCDMPNIFAIPDSYSTDSNQNSAGVIKLASIKSIIDKNQHCLLDITPNAVEHLNYAQYFPICVFLKADSHGHVKELRHKYAKNLKLKSSKRLYENSMRLSTYYSHLFTASIQLDSTQWQKKT
jgi:tight junction protein 1